MGVQVLDGRHEELAGPGSAPKEVVEETARLPHRPRAWSGHPTVLTSPENVVWCATVYPSRLRAVLRSDEHVAVLRTMDFVRTCLSVRT